MDILGLLQENREVQNLIHYYKSPTSPSGPLLLALFVEGYPENNGIIWVKAFPEEYRKLNQDVNEKYYGLKYPFYFNAVVLNKIKEAYNDAQNVVREFQDEPEEIQTDEIDPEKQLDLFGSKNAWYRFSQQEIDVFKQENAFGGNCGVYALSLAEYYHKNGIQDISFGFVCDQTDDEDVDEYLVGGEPTVYHVLLKINGEYYDGDGKVDLGDVANWVNEEYDNPSPIIYWFSYPSEKDTIEKIIRTQTNVSCTIDDFEFNKQASISEGLHYGDPDEYGDQAYQLANKYFNVLSNSDVSLVIVNEQEEVVAALFTDEMNKDKFSFDAVVHPDYQGQGLGKELVDEALSIYEERKEALGDDYYIDVHVINPAMRKILEDYGFEVDKNLNQNDVTMRYQENNSWYKMSLNENMAEEVYQMMEDGDWNLLLSDYSINKFELNSNDIKGIVDNLLSNEDSWNKIDLFVDILRRKLIEKEDPRYEEIVDRLDYRLNREDWEMIMQLGVISQDDLGNLERRRIQRNAGKCNLKKAQSENALVCIDIQSEADNYMSMDFCDLAETMSKYSKVIYVVDENMAGGIIEPEIHPKVREYYEDSVDLDLSIEDYESEDEYWQELEEAKYCSIPDHIDIKVKAYGGVLRTAIDMGLEDEAIAFFQSLLYGKENNAKNYTEFIESFMDEYGRGDFDEAFDELKSMSSELINGIPNDFWKSLGNSIDICGGGVNECLREVQMALEILGIEYNTLNQFTYAKKKNWYKVSASNEAPDSEMWDEELEGNLVPIESVKKLIPSLVERSQKIYDEWEQDENGEDVEYGSGGICHIIAENFVDILYHKLEIPATTISQSIGEQHVYVVFAADDGVYSLDINPSAYESGAAYTWTKKPNVKFDESYIEISKLDGDPKEFKNYIGY